MMKNLLYTALGLMGIMGALSVGVTNAADGITSNPNAQITYTDTNGNVFTDIGTITITQGNKSITILDRNLGATTSDSVCLSTNTGACGYHFQRGNNYGFAPNFSGDASFPGGESAIDGEMSGYADTSKNARNNPYVSSGFIVDPNWNNNGGWDGGNNKPHNPDLWGGSGDRNKNRGDSSADYKRQGPCPAGYHVPSQRELDDLLKMYHALYSGGSTLNGSSYGHYVNNTTFSTKFRNDFKMPFAGNRSQGGGVVFVLGIGGRLDLWSSSAEKVSPPYSRVFGARTDNVYADSSWVSRVFAYSVRCFLDSPLDDSGSQPLILEYVTNGGSEIQSQTIPAGEKAYLPGYTTKKDGARLLGRFNEDGTEKYALSGSNEFAFTDLTLDSNMATNRVVKIYAKWGYKVTFVDGSGNVLKVEDVASGSGATAPAQSAIPDVDGYEFSGWDKDFSNVTADMTVRAQYTPKKYSITYEVYGGVNSASNPSFYTIEYPDIKFADATRDGYDFGGWYSDAQFTSPVVIIPASSTGDKKLYAKWIAKTSGYSGGGGNGKTKDSCPGGDLSPSRYDGTCGTDNGTGNVSDSDESRNENNTPTDTSSEHQNDDKQSEDDKQLEGFTEFEQAYNFAFKNGITTMPTIKDAKMYTPLTRIAMAKMLSYYAINVLGQKPDETKNDKFNDVSQQLDSQYDNGVTLAYQLGIMGINIPDNNFRPNDEVTRAEFATALSRMLYSTPDGDPYYITHIEKLKSEGIISNDNPKMKELRGYVMIMLMRSKK